jgi:hypothetical protein
MRGVCVGELTAEERDYVLAVRDWVKREVLPVVRELEHVNTYPESSSTR